MMSNKYYIEKYKGFDTIIENYYKAKNKNGQTINITGIVNPLKVDNRQEYSVIDNQGEKPHCAAYSIAGICEALIWKRTGKLINLDADQIYAKAKELDKKQDEDGTMLECAIQAALNLGGFGKAAEKIKIGFLDNDGSDELIESIKYLIHKYSFIHAGFFIDEGWYRANNQNFKIDECGAKLGGHAVVIVGYDGDGVYIANSWGKEWGSKGFAVLPWCLVKKQLMYCCILQDCFDSWNESNTSLKPHIMTSFTIGEERDSTALTKEQKKTILEWILYLGKALLKAIAAKI